MIPRRTVVSLGFSQLIAWGVTYYLIGGFGVAMAADLGWPRETVYGGFSAALVVMGLSSAVVGRLIDRHGGRAVMTAGSVLDALGCVILAGAHSLAVYYLAWLCLGLGMRLTLYDAAFAALARIGGAAARGPISQITLLGGLASTAFWPLGEMLAAHLGWRGAVDVYAGFALLTVPLHLALPAARRVGGGGEATAPARAPLARDKRDRLVAASLYAVATTLTNFLNSAMSAHMIAILGGLGVAAAGAVWIAALRGIGQSLARLLEVLFGRRLDPLALNLVASLILPLCFLAGLLSAVSLPAALAFAFFYGAGNGILTITRGTLPLVLFEHRTYGAFVGRLLVPGFLLSAVAPLAYAFVIERLGDAAALDLSAALAAVITLSAAALALRFRARA